MTAAAAKIIITIVGQPMSVVNALDDLKQAIRECAVEMDILDMIEIKEEGA